MMRMQRWMLWTVMGVIGLTAMFFGARYAKREYHLRQPSRIWVPVALRADISMEDQKNLAMQIEEKLRTEKILRAVVMDLGLPEKFKQPSEDAAVKELNRRLFVEVGSADTPNGSLPSINIGVAGIGHEGELLGEVSMRIIREVWLMIGINPKTGKPSKSGDTPPPDSF
jgi:hypothetical protein